jgi:ectoine hydroxylase-related dioxygenase (phytanoyl-CoA dioxygenase family)
MRSLILPPRASSAHITHPTKNMSTILAAQPLIIESQKLQFKEEGYFILERCVSQEHLEMLRDNCHGFIDAADAEMTAKGVERQGLNAKGKRYFVHNCYQKEPILGKFIFSDLMAEICRATIGGEANLFWDQYVVKGTDTDSSFSWHQDSGYVHIDCPIYLTCWVTLDDVTLENGTVYLLPYSQVGIRSVVNHIRDPRTNDLVGYFGKDPGMPIILPAGSIAVFSSYVFHRSGPNLTDKLRRVYLPQYASTVILNKNGQQQGQAVPFLRNGEIVPDSVRNAAV